MRIDSGQQAYGELMQTLREAPVRDLAWLLLSADLLSAARFPAALAHFDGVHAAAETSPPSGPSSGPSSRPTSPPLPSPSSPAPQAPGTSPPGDFDPGPDPGSAPDPIFHSRDLHDWLLACDADSRPLREFLARGESHRLGRYAEQLLHYALLHSPRFELLAAGLQVRDARRGNMTLGECDFLLERRADRRLLHWELAVKLYLFVPPAASAPLDERAVQFHWLGPNLADSFADKVARLLGHQLRLTTLDAARSALPAAGPWLPQVYLKGWLFHPLTQPVQLPQAASETHGRGWWATLDEWWAHAQSAAPAGASSPARAWAMLPRARWLAPARVAASRACSLVEMHERIEAHWRERGVAEPLLVVSLARREGVEKPGAADDWFECERGFIVPDFWAPRARHRIEELSERAEAAAQRALARTAEDSAPSI
ncbi:DUF1853 family protein [Pandoraea nosoerga]|nr:DUF1853 family protein [Pandoraea nosoerga]MBN4666000.1 DUF1853 family protein [Pandoraea nosoerga]MBN4676174.1 DUF1853 family protein [Pandoraea nosoerga]MBN4681228.1 DUF1853 family protein [Pandoraea nosoerga]MBN4745284.1 DUF1853 family protein [Pandoraea nosoerga]